MPQIEAHFRGHLEQAQFSWLPQPLPAELPHPQADRLDTCCGVYLEGLVSNQRQLSELVLSLDTAYQAWFETQVSGTLRVWWLGSGVEGEGWCQQQLGELMLVLERAYNAWFMVRDAGEGSCKGWRERVSSRHAASGGDNTHVAGICKAHTRLRMLCSCSAG